MESPSPTQPTNLPVVLQTILNKPYEEIKAFSEWLKRNTSNYLIGEHPEAKSKGIHCHILIEGLKVSREALRKQVIKLAPGRGQNATMAETQHDKKKYDTELLAIYILKGHLEYCKSSSFPQTMIETWSKMWIERQPTPTAPAGQLVVKKKAPTKFEDCHKILDQYFTATPENPDAALDTTSIQGRTRIKKVIVAWANENRRAMNPYLVADYYDEILKQGIPDLYVDMCSAIINHRHRHFSHT